MIDCHMHLFSSRHLPEKVFCLPTDNNTLLFLSKLFHFILPSTNDPAEHISNFLKTLTESSEKQLKQYKELMPKVEACCPIALDFSSFGEVDYNHQLEELESLRLKNENFLYPVLHIDPRNPEYQLNFEKYIVGRKWVGVKLYASMGYLPTDERLSPIYSYCERKSIPIWTHCSRVGMFRHLEDLKNVSPENYKPVLEKYPLLKLNFSHVGGSVKKYTNIINELDVYADLSYQQNNIGTLKRFSEMQNIKFMFGTDFPICMWVKNFPESVSNILSIFNISKLDENTKDFLWKTFL